MDLGKAWAMRAQHEKQERIETERLKQEQARQRRDLGAGIVGLGQQAVERQVRIEPAGEIRRGQETAVHDQARDGAILRELDSDGRAEGDLGQ